MIRPPGRFFAVLSLVVVGLIATAVVLGLIGDLHERFHKQAPWMGAVFLGLLVIVPAAGVVWGFVVWRRSRAAGAPVVAPEDEVAAARVQAEAARALVARIENPALKAEL